jgi:hypothetical protein
MKLIKKYNKQIIQQLVAQMDAITITITSMMNMIQKDRMILMILRVQKILIGKINQMIRLK